MFPFNLSLSLLPSHLSWLETLISRLFLLLAFLTIGPWLFLILYDFLLYIFRVLSYEIPVIGGRARGQIRPRAPSVVARPDGRRRRFSLLGSDAEPEPEVDGQEKGGEKAETVLSDGGLEIVSKRSRGVRRVLAEEERDMRSWEVIEDDGAAE